MNKRQKKNRSRRKAKENRRLREMGRCREVVLARDLADVDDLAHGREPVYTWPGWLEGPGRERVRCVRWLDHDGNHVGRAKGIWYRGRDMSWNQAMLDQLELERGLRAFL